MNASSFIQKLIFMGLLTAMMIFSGGASVFADPGIVETIDALLQEDRIEEALQAIKGPLAKESDTSVLSALYSKRAYISFRQAKTAERNGEGKDTVLMFYAEGEKFADKAIQLDPANYEAFFWRGSSAGMWGKIKGVFSALDRVGDMRDDFVRCLELKPDHHLAWFSLGQMYRMLPGGIISFGDKDYAVSLGRKAVDLMEAEAAKGEGIGKLQEYYVELAKSLHARNWSARKRNSELPNKMKEFSNAKDQIERDFYYEAVVSLQNMSDREEAKNLLEGVIAHLESLPELNDYQYSVYVSATDAYDDFF